MSERIRGSYDDALYKSTYTLLCSLLVQDFYGKDAFSEWKQRCRNRHMTYSDQITIVPKPAIIIFIDFTAFSLTSIHELPASLTLPLFPPNLITVIFVPISSKVLIKLSPADSELSCSCCR